MTAHRITVTRYIKPRTLSEAERIHIHGPLVPLDAKTPTLVWLNLLTGVAVMVGLGIIGTMLVVAIGGMA